MTEGGLVCHFQKVTNSSQGPACQISGQNSFTTSREESLLLFPGHPYLEMWSGAIRSKKLLHNSKKEAWNNGGNGEQAHQLVIVSSAQ